MQVLNFRLGDILYLHTRRAEKVGLAIYDNKGHECNLGQRRRRHRKRGQRTASPSDLTFRTIRAYLRDTSLKPFLRLHLPQHESQCGCLGVVDIHDDDGKMLLD